MGKGGVRPTPPLPKTQEKKTLCLQGKNKHDNKIRNTGKNKELNGDGGGTTQTPPNYVRD